MSKHHVKIHSWKHGELSTVETLVSTLEDAMVMFAQHHDHHSTNSDGHTIKIYNSDGDLVHSVHGSGPKTPITSGSYA